MTNKKCQKLKASDKQAASQNRIKINVSGEIYETYVHSLNFFPTTLLGNRKKRQKYYCKETDQYFFNRHRVSFEAILFFYQSHGILTRPPNIDSQVFENECLFYEIPQSSILQMKQKCGDLIRKEKTVREKAKGCSRFREKLWDFLQHPESSKAASIFAIISLMIVFLSVLTTCLETMPILQKINGKETSDFWSIFEMGLNSWFLLELILRLIFCPSKCSFIRSTLNIFDIAAVVPYFIAYAINPGAVSTLGYLRILRLLRVIRLFRLSKHSERLQLVGEIIRDSVKDLQLFVVCLLIIVIFGGSLMYQIERNEINSEFYSIPQAMYWAIQTLVTVGYGDIVAQTLFGKLISSFFMVFGALTISLPVMSVVMKFTSHYELSK